MPVIKKMSASMMNPNCEASTNGFWRMSEKKNIHRIQNRVNQEKEQPCEKFSFYSLAHGPTEMH
jgi:hypothetical protein